MKTVKIVNGTYGHKPAGAYRIYPISTGETVELPDAEAERIVKLGVAEYVGTHTDDNPNANDEDDSMYHSEGREGDSDEVAGEEDGQEDSAYLDAAYLEKNMKLDELKQLAQELGIETQGLNTKARLAEAIAQVPVEPDADEEGETPPVLAAEEPV